MPSIEAIIYYIIFIDAIIANILAWCYADWYRKNYNGFWNHFPATKGWCFIYFALVLWIGYALYRLKVVF